MAYCSHCGSELVGRFCGKCGAAAPGVDQPGAPPPPPSPPPVSPPRAFSAPGLDENVASALCYLGLVITGVLFLFLEPYNKNKNIRFHAFQSIFVWIAIMVASAVVSAVFGNIFDTSGTLFLWRLIWAAFRLAVIALWLLLMYRAYKRERWVLPVAGEMAQKFA